MCTLIHLQYMASEHIILFWLINRKTRNSAVPWSHHQCLGCHAVHHRSHTEAVFHLVVPSAHDQRPLPLLPHPTYQPEPDINNPGHTDNSKWISMSKLLNSRYHYQSGYHSLIHRPYTINDQVMVVHPTPHKYKSINSETFSQPITCMVLMQLNLIYHKKTDTYQ